MAMVSAVADELSGPLAGALADPELGAMADPQRVLRIVCFAQMVMLHRVREALADAGEDVEIEPTALMQAVAQDGLEKSTRRMQTFMRQTGRGAS